MGFSDRNDCSSPNEDKGLIMGKDEVIKLKKTVSIFGGVGLIVGSIIGSGIFLSPSGVLKNSGSIGLSLIIWVACGLIALMGALCYGELGTEIPKSGAEYAYLYEAFGAIPAFLFSWTSTLLIRPSAGAIIAMTFAEYVATPFYDDSQVPEYTIKALAFVCIALIAFVNCLSVKLAVYVQNVFTVAKLGCVIILIVIGFIELGKGNTGHFENSFNGTSIDAGKISFALYSGLWAYDGWNSLNYITEEMINPIRDMPITIIISMTTVVACYLLCNIAYVTVLGFDGIVNSNTVALELGDEYLGGARVIIPVLVGLSCFGAVNGLFFSSGRLVYAAAREGHMPGILSMVQKSRLTPLPSLVFTALISTIMLIPKASEFSVLIDFFSFASWVFYGACFAALLYLRFFRKNLKRPYKVFIPIPFVMVIVSVFLTIVPIYQKPAGSLYALLAIVAGIPVYLLFLRFKVQKYLPKSCRKSTGGCVKVIVSSLGLAFPTEDENDELNDREMNILNNSNDTKNVL